MNEDSKRPAPPGEPGDDSRRAPWRSLRLTAAAPHTAADPWATGAGPWLREMPWKPARNAAPPPPPTAQQAITRASRPVWQQVDTTGMPHLDRSQTLGFTSPVGTATYAGATWISPLLRHPVEFPGIWIQKRKTYQRHLASRSRVRQLLDRLCELDEQSMPPRTMVVVAHPDDEAIGAGARLCSVSDADIVHVTDGAPRDPAYAVRKGFASRSAYARSRQDELLAALAVLGIPRERTHCLDIVDGEAADHLVTITYRIIDLFDRLRPEIALTHPYEGGHTDHDATAFAVHLACGLLRKDGAPAPLIFELTSYHLYGGVRRVGEFLPFPGVEERTVELGSDLQKRKQEVYDCFVSQRACLAAFPRNRERFRFAPRYSFTRPPHTGPLLYERVSRSLDGARWRAKAALALESLRSGGPAVSRAA